MCYRLTTTNLVSWCGSRAWKRYLVGKSVAQGMCINPRISPIWKVKMIKSRLFNKIKTWSGISQQAKSRKIKIKIITNLSPEKLPKIVFLKKTTTQIQEDGDLNDGICSLKQALLVANSVRPGTSYLKQNRYQYQLS